jgi:DUF1680 family protein
MISFSWSRTRAVFQNICFTVIGSTGDMHHCTRRDLIQMAAALGSLSLAAPLLAGVPGATGEQMAASTASRYRPYRSRASKVAQATTWIQIDLGTTQAIDAVRLYPFSKPHYSPGNGFPVRFRIECADDPAFKSPRTIVSWSKADYPDPGDRIIEFQAKRGRGRYVRLTVTKLRAERLFTSLDMAPKEVRQPYLDLIEGSHVLVLSKIEVLANGVDIAQHRPVWVDESYGDPQSASQLTRARRPQGEGVITDNPRNVTASSTWQAVAYSARAPLAGVELGNGLFRSALENNIRYLLESFGVDDLLRQFRQRAGKPLQGSAPKPGPFAAFWEDDLAGSNAGRFLMGAGNTLRWIEHAELRGRMNAVVAGIAECRQGNGYIMAYPEDTFFVSERGAYTRAWVTHGLLEAGYAGNTQAFELLRGYYDWYNSRPYLQEALRRCNWGPQGMVANTRVYFSPVGQPQDIQVLQRYFQESYWLADLKARKADAVWQYPYDRPHSYLLTILEAYLDLYRATGERSYLEAVSGGWELFRDNWQNTGGSISIIEGPDFPPKSNSLYAKLGENCGSAFWILLNQRLHQLDPDNERYVAEIEKSIYNVILANQDGSRGIRYHTMLVGQKEASQCVNSCCEGQGTRLVGSLPELIYSVADDGLYVNLFERSSIEWQLGGEVIKLAMETQFPNEPSVQLKLQPSKPLHAKIRIRTPSWATKAMEIEINGQRAAVGTPGEYVVLERTWSAGDEIAFILPISFELTEYTGVDQITGRKRYALEYGPILMAAENAADAEVPLEGATDVLELLKRLQPVPGWPLHFTAPLMAIEWSPYFEIEKDNFSCFPFIVPKVL